MTRMEKAMGRATARTTRIMKRMPTAWSGYSFNTQTNPKPAATDGKGKPVVLDEKTGKVATDHVGAAPMLDARCRVTR